MTAQPPATVTAGIPFGLTVTVEDASGDTITGFDGLVTIALASNPGGGVLRGSATATAVHGVVTFSGMTLDVADPGYQIGATATGESAGTSAAFIVAPAAASKLVLATPPPSTVGAGNPFGLVVDVEDAFGNQLGAGNDGLVTIALANNSNGDLEGTVSQTAYDGVATFVDLFLNKVGTGQSLTISQPGLTGTTTGPITVIPGRPFYFSILREPPSSVAAGASFGLEVAVEDIDYNVVTSDSSTSVTLDLFDGTGPLLGTTTLTDSSGIVDFTNLSVDKVGSFFLYINAVNATISSDLTTDVDVTPAAPSQLVIQAQPSPTASVGQSFATEPIVDEEDQYGNLETNDDSTVVTASLATGAGPLEGTTTVAVVGGVARFATLADRKVETMSLKFSAGSLTKAISNPIVVGKATPTVNWSSSSASVDGKKTITLTASVPVSLAGPTPTGTVTFLDGSKALASVPLVGLGDATFSTAGLSLGTHSITASYSGDSSYLANSSTSPLYVGDQPRGDFDGDGQSDIAVFDQTTATFSISYSGGGTRAQALGNPADKLVPVLGDYDGDGKTDLAIYDQTLAEFFVLKSGGGTIARPFGNPKDVNIPVAGDYDGDGKTDLAIYDQTLGEFFVLESGGGTIAQPFGNNTHVNIPIAGDYDGDGKTDLAIYDQTAAAFVILKSGGGSIVQSFGDAKEVNVPIAGDYDGDGKTDLAIYDQTSGVFYALESGGGTIAMPFGNMADVNIPLVGDFDGDGKTDIGVYDQTAGEFFAIRSGGGYAFIDLPFGNANHKNIPV